MLKVVRKLKKIIRNRRNLRGIKCEVEIGTSFGKNCLIDSQSSVGPYTSINNYSMVTKSKIGNYCSIGNFVTIGPGEHDLSQISTSSIFYKNAYNELTKKKCVIGNDVWIGNFALIRRGVTVGDGAVIGAHAVVTKDVPPFTVVAGVPAEIKRFRFDDSIIKCITESKWWEHPPQEAARKIEQLTTNHLPNKV